MKKIDLRSDTVTQPTQAMRDAMMSAVVGDDVFADDPTVNALEAKAAKLMGKEAALFVPSGTQSNLIALMTHCQRGEEYLVGQGAHTYLYEAGGAAVLGGIQPQPIPLEQDGTLDLGKVKTHIKKDDAHFAISKLLCIENTYNGKVLPLSYIKEAITFAKANHLNTHLDGARLFNASVKLGVSLEKLAQGFDSVSICLSKGLGAPVGSLLCGSQVFIKKAHRWRKMVGGGMRQAGILAAAGLYALDHHIDKLKDDHTHAQILAEALSGIESIEVDTDQVQTNMVFAKIQNHDFENLHQFMVDKGVVLLKNNPLRLVTHLDINREDIQYVVEMFKTYFKLKK